jgi:probable phosphoglycerate mutase
MEKVLNRKFFFVRHGMTEWNTKQLCQGQLDIELSEAGRLEVALLGASVSAFPFSRICVSPLKRALETAKILQNMLPDCNLQVIDELKERSWGELEGISSTEMYRIEELEEKNPHLLPQRGVEQRESFTARILRGINIALSHEDEPLIVSHGRVFLSLCELLNIPLIRQVPNAILIECSPTKDGWQVNIIEGFVY